MKISNIKEFIKSFQVSSILILFLICSLANLIGEGFYFNELVLVSKPLLLFLLLLFFFYNTRKSTFSAAVVNWMMLALLTSNIGDILLLFAGRSTGQELFFLGGLSAFLITHIAYIFAFRQLTPAKSYAFPVAIVLPMLVFWLGFNGLFSASLSGIMKPAVGFYSLVILIMVYFAWRLNKIQHSTSSQYVFFGALLFLISDTFVGLNKFGQDLVSIPAVGVLIMSTYLAGQALIVIGVIQLLKRSKT